MNSTETKTIRVAIIGAGPAGFYTADHLLRKATFPIQVDMFDRLPTPFGLVRAGVAPDHQKIKSVTKLYDRIAKQPNFRFFGFVEFGKDIFLEDVQTIYHQICFTTGAPADRPLGIPGEALDGSHSATEFVAWYNGHPDFRNHTFDLSQETAVVVGMGNVAIDVARILTRPVDELAKTDIANHALDALRGSRVRNVYLLGRRGPAQAAFTNHELKELMGLTDVNVVVRPEDAALDALSQAALEADGDKKQQEKVRLLQTLAVGGENGRSRTIHIHFLTSPSEIIGDTAGNVSTVKLVRNELYQTESGRLRPRATNNETTLNAGLVFRAIGYRSLPLADIPFDQSHHTVANQEGRVFSRQIGSPVLGLYTAGWAKRGPQGVIGTNKQDAVKTVTHMLTDVQTGNINYPRSGQAQTIEALLMGRQPNYISYQDWLRLDAIEQQRGQLLDRPRIKLTSIDEMLSLLAQPA